MHLEGEFHRLYPLITILSVVTFWILWFSADMADQTWVFGEKTASVLGTMDGDTSHVLFNSGCILAGSMFCIGGLIRMFSTTGNDRTIGLLLALAGPFLASVGLFPMDVDYEVHCIVASTMGILALAAVILGTYSDWKNGLYIPASVGTIGLFFCLGTLLSMDFAFIENWCILVATIWMVSDSIRIAFVYWKQHAGTLSGS